MPITPYLDGFNFNPETRRVMGLAFEMALAALRLTDWSTKELVANKIIALAREGMRDPNLLCEWTLNDLQKQPQVRAPSVSVGLIHLSREKRARLRPRR
jgi:hypothetical protein